MEAVAHLVERLAKTYSIVSGIHLNEPEQCLLESPYWGGAFFNPVASDSEIGICIASLPRITCQADFANYGGTLMRNQLAKRNKRKEETNREATLQGTQLLLEHCDYQCCNGLAPFVRLGPLRTLKSTKYQPQTQRRQY